MKRGTVTGILGTIIIAGFSLGAFADVKENPYQVIIDRNPFGLKPVPPPPEAPKQEAPVTPPPEIKLTGITTLGAAPKAFLQVEDKQTKKAEFPPPLAAGESYKDLTVVSIDVDNNTVRIKNGDAETTLDFEKNGVKATAAAAPVPHPGGIPLNPGGVPVPQPGGLGFNPVNPANPAAASGRTAIVSGGATATATPAGGFPNTYGANPAFGGLPQRPLRTDSPAIIAGGGNQVYNPNPQPVVSQQPVMSRDEAEARIEAARRMLEQQNNPQSRILPPTSLGRALNPPPVPGAK
jgi:hypothetical protein